MKLRTKLLISATAVLMALFMAACTVDEGQGNEPDAASDAAKQSASEETAVETAQEDATVGDFLTDVSEGLPENDSRPTDPESETLLAETDASKIESSDSSETDAKNEAVDPSVDGVETNKNGEIELPFVPFD